MTDARPKFRLAFLAFLLIFPAIVAAQQTPTTSDPSYLEGKRLFESLDYENAVRALDHAIAGLQVETEPARRELLASAYEMRARAKFGLGDSNGATADFVSLLRMKPTHALTGQVSPRVVSLFDAAVAANVTNFNLSVNPVTARIELDGAVVQPGLFRIATGEHTIVAEQRGYERIQQSLTANPGVVAEAAIELTRVSAVLNILTSPPDVDVTVDGQGVGKTTAGPPPAQYNEAVSRANVGSQAVSAVLSIGDVATGAHLIQVSRACYVGTTSTIAVDKPADFTVGPIVLKPATASLVVTANAPDAQVLLNGEVRGTAPLTLPTLCEGDYSVDVRSKAGHFTTRISPKAGESAKVEAVLRPSFAIASSSGVATGSTDVRPVIERALTGLRTVTIFAPPAENAKAQLDANKQPVEWLAFDANGRSLTPSAQFVQTMRSDASQKIAEGLNAQGVASVTLLGDNRIVLALLAAGSSVPDILELRLDRAETIAAVIERLDRSPALFRPSIGLTAIDVADVTGAVVVAADPKTAPGVQVGDLIVGVGGQPLTGGATALATLLDGRAANDILVLDMKSPEGATKTAKLPVVMSPRLISLFDSTVLPNRTVLDMRARLAGAKDPVEQATIRLNLAVALARSGEWDAARTELQRVQLPAGPGVSDGTVQYLMGIAADRLGNRADAEALLKKAAAAGGLVTEDGPAVRELAEARLAELQGGR